MRIVAICDAGRKPADQKARRISRLLASSCVNTFFNPHRPFLLKREMLSDMVRIARQSNLPVLVPPERDINHPEFIASLKREIKPTVALSFGCLQIYKKPLLDIFDRIVNYHNGRLPEYGGLHATSWAMYHREDRSGYTFHLMDDGIDTGNILLRGSVRVPPDALSVHVDYLKLKKASRQMTTLLDRVATRSPGKRQAGQPGYFTAHDFDRNTTIDHPSTLSLAELQRRLQAFDLLRLNIDGCWYRISRLKRCRPGGFSGNQPAFTTADGIRVKPDRFDYKPLWLKRLSDRMLP
jgi:methionyl-tRNA formyltransferase